MRTLTKLGALSILVACGGGAPVATDPTTTAARPHPANALLTDVAACWFGGMWGDAQGQSPAERDASTHKQCEAAAQTVFGKADKERVLQLRAFESVTMDEVAAKLASVAATDHDEAAHKDALVRVFRALGAAEDEAMHARRAAKRIARDLEREPEKLANDEAAALPDLEKSAGFDALASLDVGDAMKKQVHALALFVLLERMNIAKELPLHMKPYVVSGPYKTIFSALPPDVPHDASKPLVPGTWLNYLVAVAGNAGHPVTRADVTPVAKRELALAGILAGVADRLKADAEGIPTDTPLSREVHLVVRNIEAEVQGAQAK